MSSQFKVLPRRKRRRSHQPLIDKVATKSKFGSWSEDSLISEDGVKGADHLPSDLYARLAEIGTPTSFEKGAILFVEGRQPQGVFLVRRGLIKLSTGSADGKALILGRADPGNVLGLPTAISGRANKFTAEASQFVECLFIARELLLGFLGRNGQAALAVAEILSRMYEETFDQVRYLGLSFTATKKLARLILELPAHQSPNNGHTRALPLTHKEIGELIGASRETVTRLFARFKQQQLVQVKGSCVHILDHAALEQLLAP